LSSKHILLCSLALGAGHLTSGCVTIQALEPVQAPPSQFLGDVSVRIEFLQPGAVGLRCAERGTVFFGLPGINSSACADTGLITILDPCLTLTAGEYARSLCSARSEAMGPRGSSDEAPTPALRNVSFRSEIRSQEQYTISLSLVADFVDPALLEETCSARGLQPSGEYPISYCAADGVATVGNPCRTPEQRWYERTLCHELAHVNGWPADHSAAGQSSLLPLASQSPAALAAVRLAARDSALE
jgi:hypothetical protein